mgnify:CR=1 FL=1
MVPSLSNRSPGLLRITVFSVVSSVMQNGYSGSRDVLPVLDGFVAACREAEEAVAMVVGILVYLVDIAKVAVIGKLQMGRYQKECISLVVYHLLCDVLSSLGVFYAEVVDGGT